MDILVTGAHGFVGRNLVAQLKNIRYGKATWYGEIPNGGIGEIFEYDLDTDPAMLDEWCSRAGFVYNLAGVNRPKDPKEFMTGNFGFASTLLQTLERHGNRCPVMLSSSIQAELDNPYGQSKLAGEELFFEYGRRTGAHTLVYRFPNLFGKWCRPGYNSVVATFCHNMAHGLPLRVDDPAKELRLTYIDDVVDELIAALQGHEHRDGKLCTVPVEHRVTLGRIVELLQGFHDDPSRLGLPELDDPFTRKLHATYLTYLPENGFSQKLTVHSDYRGSFAEVFRTPDRGQLSINTVLPGAVKGGHWHNTKNEKFIVIAGEGVVRFRDVRNPQGEVIEYHVNGAHPEVVDVPPGYTHEIANTGDTELVSIIWCNECFDPNRPDTYREPVDNA